VLQAAGTLIIRSVNAAAYSLVEQGSLPNIGDLTSDENSQPMVALCRANCLVTVLRQTMSAVSERPNSEILAVHGDKKQKGIRTIVLSASYSNLMISRGDFASCEGPTADPCTGLVLASTHQCSHARIDPGRSSVPRLGGLGIRTTGTAAHRLPLVMKDFSASLIADN
jgi:hypothetical protein